MWPVVSKMLDNTDLEQLNRNSSVVNLSVSNVLIKT